MERGVNLLPLYFLPPIHYIRQALASKQIQISIGERYQKQTWRSRFQIAGPNNPQLLSLPVVHPYNHVSMAEIKLDHSENWQVKHWRSIETAYRRAPFFEYYAHYFEPLFQKRFFLLAELNLEALHIILKILKADTSLNIDTAFCDTITIDVNQISTPYFQVFAERHGFLKDLSILDLIFNEGPNAGNYLRSN